jgi:putative hemolysin
MLFLSLEILAILLLIVFNGLLAMAEMAIVSSRKARLRDLANSGNSGAKAALHLAESPDFLASIQAGITLVGVLAGAFSGATIAELVAQEVVRLFPAAKSYSNAIGLAIVVIPVTFLSIIIGELVPKRLALTSPERTAARVARPIQLLSLLLRPAVIVLNHVSSVILRLTGAREGKEPPVTEEEFKLIIEESTEAGVFGKAEETAIKRVLGFWDLRAADLMTPRVKVAAIDLTESEEEILETIASEVHTYFPVHEGNTDNPLGVLSTKLMAEQAARRQVPLDLKACIVTPLLVPETMTSARLLQRFRESGKHIALVIDEYGGMSGLLTPTDLLQAILGDLSEEEGHPPKVQRQDGSWLIDGMLQLRQLADDLGSPLAIDDEDGVTTVGGYIMRCLGRIPREGDVVIENGIRLEVVDMDGNRVDKVILVVTKEGA